MVAGERATTVLRFVDEPKVVMVVFWKILRNILRLRLTQKFTKCVLFLSKVTTRFDLQSKDEGALHYTLLTLFILLVLLYMDISILCKYVFLKSWALQSAKFGRPTRYPWGEFLFALSILCKYVSLKSWGLQSAKLVRPRRYPWGDFLSALISVIYFSIHCILVPLNYLYKEYHDWLSVDVIIYLIWFLINSQRWTYFYYFWYKNNFYIKKEIEYNILLQFTKKFPFIFEPSTY